MALAGSSGGSWSTTYLPRSNVRPPLTEAYVPRRENGMGIRSIAFSQDINGRPSAMGTSGGFSQGGQISITGNPPNLSCKEWRLPIFHHFYIQIVCIPF